MHYRKLFVFMLIIAACFGEISAFAQADTAESNACDAGGVWEGKCDWPTEAEREWAWTCGWYVARYEAGIITEVPVWCNYAVLTPFTPSACFVSHTGWRDFRLVGPLNTINNAEFYSTMDGTCQVEDLTSPFFIITIAGSPIADEIDIICDAISPDASGYMSHSMATYYSGVPSDWYLCEI